MTITYTDVNGVNYKKGDKFKVVDRGSINFGKIYPIDAISYPTEHQPFFEVKTGAINPILKGFNRCQIEKVEDNAPEFAPEFALDELVEVSYNKDFCTVYAAYFLFDSSPSEHLFATRPIEVYEQVNGCMRRNSYSYVRKIQDTCIIDDMVFKLTPEQYTEIKKHPVKPAP